MQRLAAEDNKKPVGNKPPETRSIPSSFADDESRSEIVGRLLGVDASKLEPPGPNPKPGSQSAEATALVLAYKSVQMKNSPEVKTSSKVPARPSPAPCGR